MPTLQQIRTELCSSSSAALGWNATVTHRSSRMIRLYSRRSTPAHERSLTPARADRTRWMRVVKPGLTGVQCAEMTSEDAIPDAPAPIPGMRPIVLYLGKRYNLTLLESEGGGHRYTVSEGPIEFAKSSEAFPADEAGWRDAWTRLNEVDRNIRRDPTYERASKVDPILVVQQPSAPPAEPLEIVSVLSAAFVWPGCVLLLHVTHVMVIPILLAPLIAAVTGFKSWRGAGRSTAGMIGLVLGLIEMSLNILVWGMLDQLNESI